MRVSKKSKGYTLAKFATLCGAILITFSAFAPMAFSCSFRMDPLAKFNKNEFVFIGTVDGYTDAIVIPGRPGTHERKGGEPGDWLVARGVKVSLKSAVYLSQTSKRQFEVFDYFYSAMCSPIGMTVDQLTERFPVGEDILVIGERSRILPDSPDTSTIRLEVRPASGLMFSMSNLKPTLRSNPNLVVDYEAWDRLDKTPGELYSLSKFELRKDLLRLEETKDSRIRREIAGRLVYYPGNFRELDILTILRDSFGDGKELDELYLRSLKRAGYSEKVIDFHLQCVQKQIKSSTYRPGEFRC